MSMPSSGRCRRCSSASPRAIHVSRHRNRPGPAGESASTASASGLLPALVVAGEAVWREVTGKGFELDIVRDPQALLGYRLRGIGAGNFATVMLATMEAAEQAAQPGAIVVNDLNAVWEAATARFQRDAEATSRPAPGASL